MKDDCEEEIEDLKKKVAKIQKIIQECICGPCSKKLTCNKRFLE